MKVFLLTGSHPRHASIARCLAEAGILSGLVIEDRGMHVPSAPDELTDDLKKLFDLHFRKRQAAESKFFTNNRLPDVEQMKTDAEGLNGKQVQSFIRKVAPDLLLSYGVHKLSDETIHACKGETWNIHGGLSPWYKGAITHFWPSYFLEPQMTGMTVHELTQKLDAGRVVHQNNAELVKGDGLHDLACRAVLGIKKELPKLINLLDRQGSLEKHANKTNGKLWLGRDWRPDHLRVIYELYEDRIVDHVLEGRISGRDPVLFRQF